MRVDLEVKAIRDYVIDGNFKKVTIDAHSIGVPKAFELAVLLEEAGIEVRGIVAHNPVGLYKQGRMDILNRYMADAGNQGKEINRNPRSRPEDSAFPSRHESLSKVGVQLVGSMVKDAIDTGLGYPKFVEDQLQVATEESPYMSRVRAPVVLAVALEDQIGQVDKIFPREEIVARLPATSEQGQLMRQILLDSGQKWDQLSAEQQARFGSKSNFEITQRQQIAEIGRVKNQYAKDKYLPNAAEVMTIESRKYPTHIATTVERSEESAHIASRIFEWMRRNPGKLSQKAA